MPFYRSLWILWEVENIASACPAFGSHTCRLGVGHYRSTWQEIESAVLGEIIDPHEIQ